MLPQKQIPQIKQQLIDHINATFPEDKKASAAENIREMSDEQLEDFLIQNKLVRAGPTPDERFQQQVPQHPKPIQNPEGVAKATSQPQLEGSCIFCNLANDLMPSKKIDENKAATAILDIHPITEGHTIVIPKRHVASAGDVPAQAYSLAKKIASKLKSKFKKATDIKVVSSNPMGHEIINIFPTYNNENLDSERQEPSEEELNKLQKKLEKKVSKKKPTPKKKVTKTPTKEKTKDTPWIPRRIP